MRDKEIFDGLIGGGKLQKDRVREDVVELKDLIITSELDRKMARLLSLHPQLRIEFRSRDLSNLDDLTKESLIHDMYDILGIAPISNG